MELKTLTLNGTTYDSFSVSDADKQKIAELTAPLVDVPEGGSGSSCGGTAWHRIGEQKMDGVESAVSFDLNGETIIEVVVASAWNKELTAKNATVSMKYENAPSQNFKAQTLQSTQYGSKNSFLIFGDSAMCRHMIFTKAEGAVYPNGSGVHVFSSGYNNDALLETVEAKATEITITFDVAPSEHTVVMVGGM